MIETIELHNFKSHRDTRLVLDNSRLHVLVGQNSSGKTSVLQATQMLSQLTEFSLEDIFKYPTSPDNIVTTGKNDFSVLINGASDTRDQKKRWVGGYKFKREYSNWQPPIVISGLENPTYEKSGWSESLHHTIFMMERQLKGSIYLKLVAANLAKADYSEQLVPQINFDGSGLAPTLDYIRGEFPDIFNSIQGRLKKIVPNALKIGIRRAKVPTNRQRLIEVDGKSISYDQSQDIIGQEIVLDMVAGERIPAHSISEGTMLALGLLTVLSGPNTSNLVLLDDIEQGLHPKAQRELLTVFKEIIQANDNLQIICTTHSPYIVDELKPSQVHVLGNTPEGFARCKRLDEHPDVEWAIQTLTTGEFWSAEGEDWVLNGEQNA